MTIRQVEAASGANTAKSFPRKGNVYHMGTGSQMDVVSLSAFASVLAKAQTQATLSRYETREPDSIGE